MIIKQYLRLFYVYNNIRRLAPKDMNANTVHRFHSFLAMFFHFFFQSIFYLSVIFKIP